jgi:hypothetical protein
MEGNHKPREPVVIKFVQRYNILRASLPKEETNANNQTNK